jgi:hypothetical protein
MRMRWVGALGALIAVVVLTVMGTMPAAAGSNGNDKLSKHDRALLIEQRASGETSTTLVVAAKSGLSASVVDALVALGGSIEYRDDALGYVRVSLSIENAYAAGKLDGIEAVDVDEVLPLPSPKPDAADDSPAVDPPGPTTPSQNAYMPTRDTGAPQFVAANPTYDGRGVTIGILDTGIDLFTPELQTAKSKTGTPQRKIIDWLTFTDPLTDDDPTWVVTGTAVTVGSSKTFVVGPNTYTAPRSGNFDFGTFVEGDPRLGGELGNDVNRDGDTTDVFGVLRQGSRVWVDSDADKSFADQSDMVQYSNNFDVGTFGTDNPATAVRETVPFVVQVDRDANAVNIGIVSGAHGTHVAGIAAGKDFFGGAYDGAAPEAQIVSVRVCLFITGCTSHALIEGMIYAAKHSDVINMSIGGLPALNDANNARAVLYDRLIDNQDVQMFISAGNSGPGINTIGDPSVATKVMSVGAYVHKDTWLNNYGAVATKTDGMFVFSSRGPREDGGFKPNISAPGAAVSSIPAWQPGSPVAGTYALPPGYGMFNGTSMAAPQATGAAALLISAAKQAGVQHHSDQLRQAINSSARYLPFYGAHEQGNGLLQVGAAWDLLKTNIRTVEIASTAPVNTIISSFLATPNVGPGLYEREGWKPGDTGSRTITLTRITQGSANYNLTLVGNDGTFSLGSSSVTLKHKQSVPVSLSIGPVTAGVHSVIMNVDNPATTGIDYQVMNTVVAAEQFNVANNFTVTKTGSADRPDRAAPKYFFYVPVGTPAFKVDVTTTSGRVRTLRQHPYGVPFDSTDTTAYCSAGVLCQTGQPLGTISRTAASPTPGVWEVTVDTSRTSTTDPGTFSITASILGVVISPTSWTVDPAHIGTAYTQLFSFTNNYGAFTGNATGSALGSAFAARPTIANAAQQQFTVNVPAGSTQLVARIGNPSDTAADLDLFVFRPNGSLAGVTADGDSEEQVTINNPGASPGNWTVLVDGFAVPTGTTAYDYLDVFALSTFGSVSITDPVALHPSLSTWSATASTTPLAAPAAGRFLQGFVRVNSSTGSLLGTAEVRLKNVGP